MSVFPVQTSLGGEIIAKSRSSEELDRCDSAWLNLVYFLAQNPDVIQFSKADIVSTGFDQVWYFSWATGKDFLKPVGKVAGKTQKQSQHNVYQITNSGVEKAKVYLGRLITNEGENGPNNYAGMRDAIYARFSTDRRRYKPRSSSVDRADPAAVRAE